MRGSLRSWSLALLLLAPPWVSCCRTTRHEAPAAKIMPRPDINEVLREHGQELMAIPGVVGVYVGLLEDGKTSCLKVMVVRKTPELESKIKKSLAGYPVVLDETGVIRPMPKK